MKIAIILGTRPEIIKISPIIRECEKRGLDHFVVHTGQHYSFEMDEIFFKELTLQQPKYNLEIGSGTQAEQTGKIMAGVEKILLKKTVDNVIVQGDTNTTLGGALAAVKLHNKISHVEAGLRSHDKGMPEEINRSLVDHMSDYLFAPTANAKRHLLTEGIPHNGIFVTGNTIVDALQQNLEIARRKNNILKNLALNPKAYFLITLHRQENVESKINLEKILSGLQLVHEQFGLPMLFPIHPRTRKKLKQFDLELGNFITFMKPLGYFEFLQLEANAKMLLTDSGGIQEETCILGVPCITLRNNTERPETLDVGSNILAGIKPSRILASVRRMSSRRRMWKHPFGDGRSSKRILRILERV